MIWLTPLSIAASTTGAARERLGRVASIGRIAMSETLTPSAGTGPDAGGAPAAPALLSRDVAYEHEGTRLLGFLAAPAEPGLRRGAPVLLFHDAFGLTPLVQGIAERLAERGHAVFAADVWGDRTQPTSQEAIGPLIGSIVGDRRRWLGRVAAAHAAAAAQEEFGDRAPVALGYCFGGSSALEHLRTGGELAGVIAIHAGLDLLEEDWSGRTADAAVLVCSGFEDPMATREQREALAGHLSEAGLDWELDLYSRTVHAFTSPAAAHSPNKAVVDYNPRSAQRSWEATLRFLAATHPGHPTSSGTSAPATGG
jgi:dienelactone hydrolase